MADDKIVTKKTAAKKATPKKTTASKPSVTGNEVKGPTAATPPAKTRSTKKVVSPAPTPSTATLSEPTTSKTVAPRKDAATKPAKIATGSRQPAYQDKPVSLKQLANVSAEERLAMIKEAAFYKAEKRNFAPGHEADDWADAERDIDELLARARSMTGN